jgi:hypothetical protein
MLDTRTIGIFIAGISQVLALQKLDPIIIINKSTVGKHKICFSKKKLSYLELFKLLPRQVIFSFIYYLQTPLSYYAYRI